MKNSLKNIRFVMVNLVTIVSVFSGCSKGENRDREDETSESSFLSDTETGAEPWEHEWKPFSDMPDCQHVGVIEDCADGWCRIPQGCFVMGSPEDQFGRSPTLEDQLTVILDQSFEIMQNEVTLREWYERGFQKPEKHAMDELEQPECVTDDCPADSVGWWSAVAYANSLSEENGFSPCYQLENCSGEVHEQAFTCDSVTTSADSLYECEGYRLPTEAEWEYAARAGTQTAFYSGPMVSSAEDVDCDSQPYLISDAWYCFNSEKRAHPIAQKSPNRWGLYDVLGNVSEWTNDVGNVPLPVGPVHNLNPELLNNTIRTSRGGLYYDRPSVLTTSKRIGVPFETTHTGYGLRLVRTLGD